METEKEKKINSSTKVWIIVGAAVLSVIILYLGISLFFMNRFYFGTKVNNISIAGKTVDEANEYISSEIKDYKLKLIEKGDKSEEITADDIDLKYTGKEDIEKMKDNQSGFEWINGLANEYNVTNDLQFNEEKLKQKVQNLSCVKSKELVESKNPTFEYSDNEYKIVPEVYGDRVDEEALYNNIVDSVKSAKESLDLEKSDCYVLPLYTTESQEVKDTKATLDKYASTKVTYTFGEKSEIVDGSKIKDWITVGDDLSINIDDKKVLKYFYDLSAIYDTVGVTRQFKTTGGQNVSISGGDYGWSINSAGETPKLIELIKAGSTETREPEYKSKAISRNTSNDIGNTYVEVSLSGQHMWFYKNGSLVIESDVVTGNPNAGNATPAGVYKVDDKEADAVLRGPGYETDVKYWMPFNGGIGLHDAWWKSAFGGSVYQSNGSHGCVNLPTNVAKTVFDNIEVGTPVVCY